MKSSDARWIAARLAVAACGLLLTCVLPSSAFAEEHIAWSSSPVPEAKQITSISCPSTALCVAVAGGDAITSSEPERDVWGKPERIDPAPGGGELQLFGVACPSRTLCVAVDQDGNIITSTEPARGIWSAPVKVDSKENELVPYNEILHVSCPSTRLCLAIDWNSEVLVSTAPTDPASWHKDAVPGGQSDLGCASETLCFALGDETLSESTDPAAGRWSEPRVIMPRRWLDALSCPSASFCVIVGQNGAVVTSTDPTAGFWSTPTVISTAEWLGGVSCASETMCLARASEGEIITSTEPTANVWSVPESIDGRVWAGVDTCTTWGLCVTSGSDHGSERIFSGIAAVDVTRPSIAGPVAIGQTLDALKGDWLQSPTTRSYQWQICNDQGAECTAIHAATTASYTISATQSGRTFRVVETVDISGGSTATATSAPTSPVPVGAPLSHEHRGSPPAHLLTKELLCHRTPVLTSLVVSHGLVRLTGLAAPHRGIEQVAIELVGNRHPVTEAVIQANGSFITVAALPRHPARAAYRAVVGHLVSAAVALDQRVRLVKVVQEGTIVHVEGRVSGRFTPGTPVTLWASSNCTRLRLRAPATLSSSGTFSATVRVPHHSTWTGAYVQPRELQEDLYIAQTTILQSGRPMTVDSLPISPT
jgi:hypothetical protein